jgi:CcmD family protein
LALALAAVLLAAMALPAVTLAAEGSEPVPVEQGQHFQIEDNTSGEPDANLPFLFAVFMITWGLFFAYVIYMTLKQRRMQAEIEALAAALQEKIGTHP